MSLRAEDFEPRAPSAKPAGRVHRLEDDDEVPLAPDARGNPEPELMPFLAAGAKGELITSKGVAMPKGHYPRKPKAEAIPGAEAPATTGTKKKRKAARRAARATPASGGGRRFGVFNDGSVQVDTSECKGNLLPEEAAALVEFIQRLKK